MPAPQSAIKHVCHKFATSIVCVDGSEYEKILNLEWTLMLSTNDESTKSVNNKAVDRCRDPVLI